MRGVGDVMSNLMNVLSGRRRQEIRREIKNENKVIKGVFVEAEKSRIEDLKAEASEENDPRLSEYIEREIDFRRERLTRAEELLKGVGL